MYAINPQYPWVLYPRIQRLWNKFRKKIFMRFQKAKSEFASTSKLYVNTQNLHISYTSMSNLQVI